MRFLVLPLLAVSVTSVALAKEPGGAAPASETLPRDTVGGHFSMGAGPGLAVPFGSLASGAAQSDVLSTGFQIAGDVTYGVSRSVMLGVYGEWARLPGNGVWEGESATEIGVGPLVRYHLAQGVRFDPWVSYGLGLRTLSIGSESLTGIDWARIQVGGEWYVASALGFGPYLGMSLGTYFGDATSAGKAVNGLFTVGLRIVFDTPGK
jgi:hypothetical protein